MEQNNRRASENIYYFLKAIHRKRDPTRMAPTEKTIIDTLMVPWACQFSTPIHPPKVSNNTPRNIPIPFMMMETILPMSFFKVIHASIWNFKIEKYIAGKGEEKKTPKGQLDFQASLQRPASFWWLWGRLKKQKSSSKSDRRMYCHQFSTIPRILSLPIDPFLWSL